MRSMATRTRFSFFGTNDVFDFFKSLQWWLGVFFIRPFLLRPGVSPFHTKEKIKPFVATALLIFGCVWAALAVDHQPLALTAIFTTSFLFGI